MSNEVNDADYDAPPVEGSTLLTIRYSASHSVAHRHTRVDRQTDRQTHKNWYNYVVPTNLSRLMSRGNVRSSMGMIHVITRLQCAINRASCDKGGADKLLWLTLTTVYTTATIPISLHLRVVDRLLCGPFSMATSSSSSSSSWTSRFILICVILFSGGKKGQKSIIRESVSRSTSPLIAFQLRVEWV